MGCVWACMAILLRRRIARKVQRGNIIRSHIYENRYLGELGPQRGSLIPYRSRALLFSACAGGLDDLAVPLVFAPQVRGKFLRRAARRVSDERGQARAVVGRRHDRDSLALEAGDDGLG